MSIKPTGVVSIRAPKGRRKKGSRGPLKGQGGRTPGPKKVPLGTVRVLPQTLDAIRALGKIGEVLDAHFGGSNAVAQTPPIETPSTELYGN